VTDIKILQARGSNRIMGLLIAFQLAMLVVIGILLVQLLTHEALPFTTIFSSIFLILSCMPLSLYLGITARDSVQKKIMEVYGYSVSGTQSYWIE
jgi:ACR3 family arsenite efflux pump ArsB